MYKYIYESNVNLFLKSIFSFRWLCWILFLSLTIVLLLLSYLYISPLHNKINYNRQQNENLDKTIALFDPHDIQPASSFSSKKNFNHVIYVISLDGKITAIDVRRKGHQVWIADMGSPLVDSTISKIEILRDSKSTRLVPSLVGGLYRLYDDNENMEPLPFDVESLLNTSFQIQDELVMTGGKSVDTIGLDLQTGKTIYSFAKDDGTPTASDSSTCSASMLIIKRIKQTVRARCMRSGNEKWNFSVSNHELIQIYVPSSDKILEQIDNHSEQPIHFEYQLQTGLVLAFDSNNNLLWTSPINKPIAAVWELKNGQLKEKSLLQTKLSHRLAFMGKFNSMPYLIISARTQRQLIHNARKTNDVSSANIKRSVLSFVHKTNIQHRLSIDYELSKANNKHSTNDHNYPLAIRQDQSWDPIGYLALSNPHESTVDVNIKSTGILSTNILIVSSVCLCTLIAMLIWFSKRKQVDIQHQQSVISENKAILFEHELSQPSLTSSFQSRYTLEYEHVRFLGRGGFGVVFESINKLDQRRVAIKRVSLKKSSSKERALKEIRCLAVLNHRNLIQYYYAWHECPPSEWQEEKDSNFMATNNELTKDSLSLFSSSIQLQKRKSPSLSYISPLIDFTFERSLNQSQIRDESNSSLFEHSQDNHDQIVRNRSESSSEQSTSDCPITYFYFVMELCQTESLRNRLMKQTINQSEAWLIFDEIINGIEYIHLQKLIHRDLKPSNILFSMDNIVKIGDFGLVSAFGEEKIDQTENNELGGTILYMSPEQLNRQSYNQKVDIYAVGIILFELLYPFSTQMERIRTLKNIRLQAPVFPNDFKCNQLICRLIRWLLAHSPHERPKACELRQDISYQNILRNENLSC
ncbi:unnamed protein product [Rotaria magnacalcarata]|uniref:PRKR-like endoplasmic reticulum kinase n=3 Tax=Rotaria magnacalcarata TaxID=392030 RepID=A0A816ULQ1_9BILA|nr:unnamed protein product [Rotaria magnacalcarata]